MRISDFGLGFCGEMELPGFGKVKVFATTIGQRKHYLASTDTSIGPDELLVRYKGRWPIEEHFRVLKQSLGLKACQCRKDAAVVNHVTAVYLAYCVLEVLANNEKHTHGQAKRIMQEEFFQHEQKLPSLKHRKHVIKLEA
jgi:IS4 transposase